jgi:hypothetical protein
MAQAQIRETVSVGDRKLELVKTTGGKYIIYGYAYDGMFWLQQNLCEMKSPAGYLCEITARQHYATYVDRLTTGQPWLAY